MNERIRLRFMQEGSPVGISFLSDEGILFNNESDAWPRGFTLRFGGDDDITRYRMNRVCIIEGWEADRFKLQLSTSQGELLITGVKHDTFPAGRYWFELQIADLKIKPSWFGIAVEEKGEAFREVRVEDDPRRVVLSLPLDEFDAELQRVLLDPGSRLDGMTAVEWLSDQSRRARRKACLLNILAKLRAAPASVGTLINHVARVFFADVDRIYAKVTPSFLAELDLLSKNDRKPFIDEGTPKSATHRKLLERIWATGLEPGIDGYRLRSFHQEGSPSLQAVVAYPPADDAQRNHYAEIDIDLGNPLQDVAGLLIHFGELLAPGKTDHLKLHAKLAKDKKVKPFLYYVVDRQKQT
jgi:hypothetical protein